MIIKQETLSIAEAKGYLDKKEEKDAEVNAFIEKFVKLSPEQAKDMREKLSDVSDIKIKPEHISKIIDILPEDVEDLNKILTEVSLDEDETKKILNIIEEFK